MLHGSILRIHKVTALYNMFRRGLNLICTFVWSLIICRYSLNPEKLVSTSKNSTQYDILGKMTPHSSIHQGDWLRAQKDTRREWLRIFWYTADIDSACSMIPGENDSAHFDTPGRLTPRAVWYPPGEKNFWGLYPNVSIKIETYPFLFETFSQAQFTIINAFERETHSKYVNTAAKQTSISAPSIHP